MWCCCNLRPHNNRQFVDLIYRNNRGKFANLEPSAPIEVGDYGYVDKDTARFLKQGNIFQEGEVIELGIQTTIARTSEFNFYASGTTSRNVDGTVTAHIPEFGSCNVKLHLKYSKGCGAAVLMKNVSLTRIDKPGNIPKLFEHGILQKNQAIVTDVYACPSYALLLGGNEGGEAFFGFRAAIPGSKGEAALQSGWTGWSSSGEVQCSSDPQNRDVFYPVALLRGIKQTFGVDRVRKEATGHGTTLSRLPTKVRPLPVIPVGVEQEAPLIPLTPLHITRPRSHLQQRSISSPS